MTSPEIRQLTPLDDRSAFSSGHAALDQFFRKYAGQNQSAQGSGLGKDLLRFVCKLAVQMSADFGCVGVVVDAKPEAIGFYERFGFHVLTTETPSSAPGPQPMFLAVGTIVRATGTA